MKILGLSAFQPGASAALLVDGVPLAAASEERFSRRKGDSSFPQRAVRACLGAGGLQPHELDAVVWFEKPLRRFERVLACELRAFPRSARAFRRTMFQWLGERLWLKGRIADEIGVPPGKVLFVEHHRSHAASAYLSSDAADAAVLVLDGEGEWAATSLWRGTGGKLELLDEVRFPHSLGLFCSAIAEFLGFAPDAGGERRVAELAGFGEPRFADQLRSLVRLGPDGSYELDTTPFVFAWESERRVGDGLTALLGEPRRPNAPLRYTGADRRDADVAASLQLVLEETVLALARELYRRAPLDTLCLAGEVAHNAALVARLVRDGPFARLLVPPAPGDLGAALGAALHAQQELAGGPRWVQRHDFLGERCPEDPGPDARALPDDEAVLDVLLEHLLAGRTVGWARGRFECGPRSLGARSILADPRQPGMKAHLQGKVKHREAFRPYDPALPLEALDRLFLLPEGARQPARSFGVALAARDGLASTAPAALHVDGTARPQAVDAAVDPLFHRLLTRFGERTGVPLLLHTSLNLRGDPPARGEADALAVLQRTALDALVVERRLYAKA